MTNNICKYRTTHGIVVSLILAFIFIGAGFLATRKIEQYFIQIQQEVTTQNIWVIEGIFSRSMRSLSILVTDWAMWDDMYDFINEPSEEFLESDFQDSSFEEIGVNIAVVIGQDQQVLFSKQIYDQLPGEEVVPVAVMEEIFRMWPDGSQVDVDEVRSSILSIGPKKLLIASRQVTMSDGSGEAGGVVIFGRFIEKEFLTEFENVPGFFFDVVSYPSNDSVLMASLGNSENGMDVRIENQRRIVGSKVVNDITPGKPVILQVEHIPTLYAKFIDVVVFLSLLMLMAYLAVVMTVIILIKKIT